MGWDAYSYYQDGSLVQRENMTRAEKLWFTKAEKDVVAMTGFVDGGLRNGALDNSSSGKFMKQLIGLEIDHVGMITNQYIRDNFKAEYIADPGYQSALHFILGCLRFNLNIQFSY